MVSFSRVWIHRGNIHIIPLPQTPLELLTIPSKLTLSTALELVADVLTINVVLCLCLGNSGYGCSR